VIEFSPNGIFSMRRYALTRDGAEIGQIDCGGAGGRATISIGGATCTPVTDSLIRGKFHLEKNGTLIASVQSAGFWRRRFDIQTGAKSCTLLALWSGRSFALMQNDAEVGRIGATGFFGGKGMAALPDDLPLEVQAFLIWLVIATWRRAVVATTIAGTAAGR
jgi:hypothetical protein